MLLPAVGGGPATLWTPPPPPSSGAGPHHPGGLNAVEAPSTLLTYEAAMRVPVIRAIDEYLARATKTGFATTQRELPLQSALPAHVAGHIATLRRIFVVLVMTCDAKTGEFVPPNRCAWLAGDLTSLLGDDATNDDYVREACGTFGARGFRHVDPLTLDKCKGLVAGTHSYVQIHMVRGSTAASTSAAPAKSGDTLGAKQQAKRTAPKPRQAIVTDATLLHRYTSACGKFVRAVTAASTADVTSTFELERSLVVDRERRDFVDHRAGNLLRTSQLLLENGEYAQLAKALALMTTEIDVRRGRVGDLTLEPVTLEALIEPATQTVTCVIRDVEDDDDDDDDHDDKSGKNTNAAHGAVVVAAPRNKSNKKYRFFSPPGRQDDYWGGPARATKMQISYELLRVVALLDIMSNVAKHGTGVCVVTRRPDRLTFANAVNTAQAAKTKPDDATETGTGLAALRRECARIGVDVTFRLTHDGGSPDTSTSDGGDDDDDDGQSAGAWWTTELLVNSVLDDDGADDDDGEGAFGGGGAPPTTTTKAASTRDTAIERSRPVSSSSSSSAAANGVANTNESDASSSSAASPVGPPQRTLLPGEGLAASSSPPPPPPRGPASPEELASLLSAYEWVLCEDNAVIAELWARLFRKMGLRLATASTPPEIAALEATVAFALRTGKPVVVCMDENLAEFDLDTSTTAPVSGTELRTRFLRRPALRAAFTSHRLFFAAASASDVPDDGRLAASVGKAGTTSTMLRRILDGVRRAAAVPAAATGLPDHPHQRQHHARKRGAAADGAAAADDDGPSSDRAPPVHRRRIE